MGIMITEKAYAKLNLDLEVYPLRDDGFHEIKSVAIPLKLADEIKIEFSKKNEIICDVEIKDNIVKKARDLFNKKFRKNKPVKIIITKKIPLGSGLGGGSADAAATLRGLSRLYNKKVNYKELEDLAEKLGSDVKFCLYSRSAIMTGRGESLYFIPAPKIDDILLFVPKIEISTAQVYKNCVGREKTKEKAYKSILLRDYKTFYEEMDNDLLKPALKMYPNFKKVYGILKKYFPRIKMSGSGSSLFIVNPRFDLFNSIRKIVTEELKDQKGNIFYTSILK